MKSFEFSDMVAKRFEAFMWGGKGPNEALDYLMIRFKFCNNKHKCELKHPPIDEFTEKRIYGVKPLGTDTNKFIHYLLDCYEQGDIRKSAISPWASLYVYYRTKEVFKEKFQIKSDYVDDIIKTQLGLEDPREYEKEDKKHNANEDDWYEDYNYEFYKQEYDLRKEEREKAKKDAKKENYNQMSKSWEENRNKMTKTSHELTRIIPLKHNGCLVIPLHQDWMKMFHGTPIFIVYIDEDNYLNIRSITRMKS